MGWKNRRNLVAFCSSAGRAAFANLAVLSAVVLVAGFGGGSASADVSHAGPLDDTWDYLVELWRTLMGA